MLILDDGRENQINVMTLPAKSLRMRLFVYDIWLKAVKNWRDSSNAADVMRHICSRESRLWVMP